MEDDKQLRTHKSKAKRPKQKSWVEEAKDLQEKILARRGGQLLPDSTLVIRAMREGRTR